MSDDTDDRIDGFIARENERRGRGDDDGDDDPPPGSRRDFVRRLREDPDDGGTEGN